MRGEIVIVINTAESDHDAVTLKITGVGTTDEVSVDLDPQEAAAFGKLLINIEDVCG